MILIKEKRINIPVDRVGCSFNKTSKMINSFKSNQDLTKTKFKASENHFSGPPASQKFVRNPYETHNEL